MAASRFSPATSVANQIRNTHLGVNMGGTKGRLRSAHKGFGLNQNKGGMNTRGTGKNPMMPERNPFAKPAAPKPFTGIGAPAPAGTPAPVPVGAKAPAKPGGYLWVTQGGKWVRMHESKLTPAARAKAQNFSRNKAPVTPGVEAPASHTGQPAAPVTPPGLDYRSQSEYIRSQAMLNEGLARDRRGIQSQLEENKRLYEAQTREAKDGYVRDVEQGEDALNRSGLLRSGTREVADADRFKGFNSYMSELETSLGSGATARLNAALAEMERMEALEREALEARARDQWAELYPAAPIAEQVVEEAGPVAGPVAGTPARATAAPKPLGGPSPIGTVKPGTPPPVPAYLRVYVPNGQGGYKIGTKSTSKMSDAEIKAAMASPLNK